MGAGPAWRAWRLENLRRRLACFVRIRRPACGGRRRSNSLRNSSGSSTAWTASALSLGGSLMLPEQDARRRSSPFDPTRGLQDGGGRRTLCPRRAEVASERVRHRYWTIARQPHSGGALLHDDARAGPDRLFDTGATAPDRRGRRRVAIDARGSLISSLLGHAAADGGLRQRLGCRDASRRPSQRTSAAAPGRTRS